MFRFIKTHIRWICWVGVLLWTFVICSFSGQSGEESGSLSDAVTLFLEEGLGRMGLSLEISPFLIRKLAHFSEYAILGCLVALAAKANFGKERRGLFWGSLWYPLAVATVDEGLVQRFSAGRHPSFWDVCLDFSGAAVGFLMVWLLFFWLSAKKAKKVRKIACKKQESS